LIWDCITIAVAGRENEGNPSFRKIDGDLHGYFLAKVKVEDSALRLLVIDRFQREHDVLKRPDFSGAKAAKHVLGIESDEAPILNKHDR
jgi:hypothetical protein